MGEHNLRARYKGSVPSMAAVGGRVRCGKRVGENLGEWCLLDADKNMRGLESRVQVRTSLARKKVMDED